MRMKEYDMKELQYYRDQWYALTPNELPEKFQSNFRVRKKAIDMYIDGSLVETIEKETGVDRKSLYRYLKKVLATDEKGSWYGYYALIPGYRIKNTDYCEKTNANPGKFTRLIERYPELHDFILGLYYGDKAYTTEKHMNYISIHSCFIKKLVQLGVQEYEYPFNTSNLGYQSLIKYIKDCAGKNIEKSANREHKDSRQKLLSTGIGTRYSTMPLAPYSVLQIDGHKLDMGYVIEVDNRDGTVSKTFATRPWLIAAIDVSTRVIVGYHVTQSRNYDRIALLQAIKNSILPRKKMSFTLKGLEYPDNGGYPSMAFSEYVGYALPNSIMIDNAKSHLSKDVQNQLIDTLNCSLCFGAVATPETRGIIERFFSTLETRGFHKLPGTTGSNPRDPKRNNPEKQVIRYDITFDKLLELMEVIIAEYNNSVHKGIYGETPMECMERKLKHTCLRPVIAGDELIPEIEKLTYFRKSVTVRGNKQHGRRPYIQFQNACYRNDILASDMSYIGKELTIIVNPDDISHVEAYNEAGYSLGLLVANGEYGTVPHSLKTRKNASKLSRERQTNHMKYEKQLTDYEKVIKDNAKIGRGAATKADMLRREMKKPTVTEQIKMNEMERMSDEILYHEKPFDSDGVNTMDFELTQEEFFVKYFL